MLLIRYRTWSVVRMCRMYMVIKALLPSLLMAEGVLSYSMPEGSVRGRGLELMDHTFDGREDGATGHLRGGIGQLVDGRFATDEDRQEEGEDRIRGASMLGRCYIVCTVVVQSVMEKRKEERA